MKWLHYGTWIAAAVFVPFFIVTGRDRMAAAQAAWLVPNLIAWAVYVAFEKEA